MATPHIKANKGDFAKVVLMPGDPYRAKWIADTFLTDVKLVNDVRGMLGFTGYTKNGKRVSVMASGMGQPSIGIYSFELFSEFDVETIIRVGTCGAYQPEINLKDIIVGVGASTDSNWLSQFNLGGTLSAIADFSLIKAAETSCENKGLKAHFGNILSSDVFYDFDPNSWKKWADLGVLAVEMESYALYVNALRLHKKALCILAVSDSFITHTDISSEERQNSLTEMVSLGVDIAEKFA